MSESGIVRNGGIILIGQQILIKNIKTKDGKDGQSLWEKIDLKKFKK